MIEKIANPAMELPRELTFEVEQDAVLVAVLLLTKGEFLGVKDKCVFEEADEMT